MFLFKSCSSTYFFHRNISINSFVKKRWIWIIKRKPLKEESIFIANSKSLLYFNELNELRNELFEGMKYFWCNFQIEEMSVFVCYRISKRQTTNIRHVRIITIGVFPIFQFCPIEFSLNFQQTHKLAKITALTNIIYK